MFGVVVRGAVGVVARRAGAFGCTVVRRCIVRSSIVAGRCSGGWAGVVPVPTPVLIWVGLLPKPTCVGLVVVGVRWSRVPGLEGAAGDTVVWFWLPARCGEVGVI